MRRLKRRGIIARGFSGSKNEEKKKRIVTNREDGIGETAKTNEKKCEAL